LRVSEAERKERGVENFEKKRYRAPAHNYLPRKKGKLRTSSEETPEGGFEKESPLRGKNQILLYRGGGD